MRLGNLVFEYEIFHRAGVKNQADDALFRLYTEEKYASRYQKYLV